MHSTRADGHDCRVTACAVLLRAVNVGKLNRIAMTDLRELLTDIGCSAVRTHLNSGNAVVLAPGADPRWFAGAVEDAITRRLRMDVRCVVRTAEHMRAAVAGNPHSGAGSRLLALFLSAAPDPARLATHDPTALDPLRVRLGDQVIYQWCPDGVRAAPAVGAFVERHLGVAVTARNWNTVTSLAAMLDSM